MKRTNAVHLVAAGTGLFLTLLLPITNTWAQGGVNMTAELDVMLRVQSGSLVPVIGDYVGHEVIIKNIGGSAIQDQLLWVRFAHGNAESKGTFYIPPLAPGASAQLHIGPF